MPANLPVEWFKAKEEYDQAKDVKERIRLLEKLISVTPTHKGCEKLLMQLKKSLAKLKKGTVKKKVTKGSGIAIKKEGAAQVVLLGFPSSGKSYLLRTLTNAKPEVSSVPFTTRKPEVGSMRWLNINIQIVEIPAIVPGGSENRMWLGLARSADLVILVLDPSQPEQLAQLKSELEQEGIEILIMPLYTRGDLTKKPNCVNLTDPRQVEELKSKIWKQLNLIRIYTRTRHTEPDLSRPVTLPSGSTVNDLSKVIHKDFQKSLKFARVWRGKFKGLQAGMDYELKDEDVVELVV